MNAMFAFSEYGEPYRLAQLGFSHSHFTERFLIPEVPPKAMRELLERKWGMGPSLAIACISVWGGESSTLRLLLMYSCKPSDNHRRT